MPNRGEGEAESRVGSGGPVPNKPLSRLILSVPSLQKTVVNYSSNLPGNFALTNGGDF